MISPSKLKNALDDMILSASGWRKVFAPGGPESSSASPAQVDLFLAAAAGVVFAQWLGEHSPRPEPRILVGTDTRPTGPALADQIRQALEASDCQPLSLGIVAAPEIITLAGQDPDIQGFVYVSASHNPVGYNGVKFGLASGVIKKEASLDLISRFKVAIHHPQAVQKLQGLVVKPREPGKKRPEEKSSPSKKRALQTYQRFLEKIAQGPGEPPPLIIPALKQELARRPLGILADMNGSARTLSADRPHLEAMGIALKTLNSLPGQIAHTILPEGEALEPCRLALEEAQAQNPAYTLGYVPDNDGDRGNLVYFDEKQGRAQSLEAQEVFALTVLAELAVLAWRGGLSSPSPRTAVVVNGPTSLRVREIAQAFGAEVHEAEVGEANVLERAEELRREGFLVRVLGEGSNGGCIIHPSTVRDPLNTVTALIKFLRLPPGQHSPSPFGLWCRKIHRPQGDQPNFSLGDVLASLPSWTTTPASAERGILQIKTTDQNALKTAWEEIFQKEWQRRREYLEKTCGFFSWEGIQNEGSRSRKGLGAAARSAPGSGGLKVLFRNREGREAGFLWMRGSGTEPLFRVMVDLKGMFPQREKDLIHWHRGMVLQADALVSGQPETP